jgi:ATP-dependent phosphoenolpyruvate carboxykinase
MGSLADKAKMDAANETIMSAREKYRTETQYNPSKTTGLQAVKSNFQKFKDKANQIVKGSATVSAFRRYR